MFHDEIYDSISSATSFKASFLLHLLLHLFEVSGPSGPYWLIAFAESMEAGFRLPCRLQPPVCEPGASIASAEHRFRVLRAV